MAVLFPEDYICFLQAALPPPVSRDNEFNTREKLISSSQQGFGACAGPQLPGKMREMRAVTTSGCCGISQLLGKVVEHFLPGITFFALFTQGLFAALHLLFFWAAGRSLLVAVSVFGVLVVAPGGILARGIPSCHIHHCAHCLSSFHPSFLGAEGKYPFPVLVNE